MSSLHFRKPLQVLELVALLSVVAVLAYGCSDDARFKQYQHALEIATIPLSQAIEVASAEVPGGRVVEAELDPDGDPMFEVEFWVDGSAQQVMVDPRTGEVLLVEPIDETYSSCSTIPFAEAVVIAEGHIGGGRAVAIRQEGCELEVHVAGADRLFEVELNANGGHVETEKTDDDDEEWD